MKTKDPNPIFIICSVVGAGVIVITTVKLLWNTVCWFDSVNAHIKEPHLVIQQTNSYYTNFFNEVKSKDSRFIITNSPSINWSETHIYNEEGVQIK